MQVEIFDGNFEDNISKFALVYHPADHSRVFQMPSCDAFDGVYFPTQPAEEDFSTWKRDLSNLVRESSSQWCWLSAHQLKMFLNKFANVQQLVISISLFIQFLDAGSFYYTPLGTALVRTMQKTCRYAFCPLILSK